MSSAVRRASMAAAQRREEDFAPPPMADSSDDEEDPPQWEDEVMLEVRARRSLQRAARSASPQRRADGLLVSNPRARSLTRFLVRSLSFTHTHAR